MHLQSRAFVTHSTSLQKLVLVVEGGSLIELGACVRADLWNGYIFFRRGEGRLVMPQLQLLLWIPVFIGYDMVPCHNESRNRFCVSATRRI
jgi:hypothetical protein